MWFWNKSKKRKELPVKLDFFALEKLYAEGRELFLQGDHEEAIECFKRIYEETADFLDVSEIVMDYYSEKKDRWIQKYQSRFKEPKP